MKPLKGKKKNKILDKTIKSESPALTKVSSEETTALTNMLDEKLTTLTKVVEEESTTPTKVPYVGESELACQMACQTKRAKHIHVPIQVDINKITISQVINKRCQAVVEHKSRLMTQRGQVITISKPTKVDTITINLV